MSTVGRQLLSIASVATVARLLGPRAYGVMAMANILMVFILNFKDLGTGSAIIQRPAISKAFLSSIFWINCCFGLLIAGFICAVSPVLAAFFKTPELIPILCVLAVSFWLTSCGITHNYFLICQMRFRALAAADLSAALVAYLVALGFAYRLRRLEPGLC